MAKKRKKSSAPKGGNPAKAVAGTAATKSAAASPRRRRRFKTWEVSVLAVVALAALWIAWSWWSSRSSTSAFDDLAAQGRAALSSVESLPNAGQDHLVQGQNFRYPSEFPTSGPHDPVPIDPGFYTNPQRPTRLVHAIEHGHVVIYYDDPGSAAVSTIREWTGMFRGPWSGFVAVPKPGLGKEVVLTAWQRRLRLTEFDPAAAAAFIDLFRGRGPENPVR